MRALHASSLRCVAGVLLGLAGGTASRAATVPHEESFESYPNGYAITNVSDWSSDPTGFGVVTNDAAVIAALGVYTNAGHAFPLAGATHTNVLAVSQGITNSVSSATGGVVLADFLVLPSVSDALPAGGTNWQCAFCLNTSTQLVVWQRSLSPATNAWLALTNTPALATGAWFRVQVVQDYAHSMYQIRVNGSAPLSDAAGYTAGGASQSGSWFYMVQTNRSMARFRLSDPDKAGISAYFDDLVFTKRSLSFSGAAFGETAANNGTISNSLTLTLNGDTFSNGTYVAGTHYTTSGVPAGLTCSVNYLNATQLTVSLTGTAAPHTAAASTNMTLTLLNPAFTLGVAADVTGYSRSDLAVNFLDPPVLTNTPVAFAEAALNDGSIGNTIAVTLTGDAFTNVSPMVENTHYTVSGVPSGLTFALTRSDATQLVASLTGNHVPHGAVESTNLMLTFKDAAFVNVAASNITGIVRQLAVTFVDTPLLTYTPSTYVETAANDGSVGGGIITVAADAFTGSAGENFATNSAKLVISNLPNGLTAVVTRAALNTELDVSFTGKATAHANPQDVFTLTFAFQNGAFAGNNASAVSNAVRSDLRIDFQNPPVVTYGGATFSEVAANNGAITNTIAVTLSGDTFTNIPTLVANTHYTVTGVPNGLTFVLTRASSTQLVAQLTGTANPHGSGAGTTLTLTFLNAAFSNVATNNILNTTASFAVSFTDPPVLTYGGTSFLELSGGRIDNTTPVTITLSADTFASGTEFVGEGKASIAPGLPTGLTAVVTRVNGNLLNVTLTGAAVNNASANSTNFTLTFLNSAFAVVQADQVTGYQQSFNITFSDSTLFINTVPYAEPFEGYGDGFAIVGTNGWQSGTWDAGVVTTETAIVTALGGYGGTGYPITTNHTKVLRLTESVSNEIRSAVGGTVYADFMAYLTARDTVPAAIANSQFGMYVDTNQHVAVWHRNVTGVASNEWRVLSGSPVVATSAWHRITFRQDYVHQMFQVRMDEGKPIEDTAGWSAPGAGAVQPGSWFHMVQTNGFMARLRLEGGTAGTAWYLDDLTVTVQTPYYLFPAGTVFKFR